MSRRGNWPGRVGGCDAWSRKSPGFVPGLRCGLVKTNGPCLVSDPGAGAVVGEGAGAEHAVRLVTRGRLPVLLSGSGPLWVLRGLGAVRG